MSKQTWRQFFASRWITGVALLIVMVLLFAFVRAYIQRYTIEQEITRLREEAKRLESKKIETIDLLNYVKSPAFVEEKARTELNMIKDGEQVAIVKQSGEKGSRQAKDVLLESMQRSNPRKWWDYFFH